MKHIENLFIDTVLGFFDGLERIQNMFRKKPKVTYLTANIDWCTNSNWMERLISYKQLDLWTSNKH